MLFDARSNLIRHTGQNGCVMWGARHKMQSVAYLNSMGIVLILINKIIHNICWQQQSSYCLYEIFANYNQLLISIQ